MRCHPGRTTSITLALTVFTLTGCGGEGGTCPEDSRFVSDTGTLSFVDVEGGCYNIRADGGGSYQPAGLPEDLRSRGIAGIRVRFSGCTRSEYTTCQTGILLELDSIEREE